MIWLWVLRRELALREWQLTRARRAARDDTSDYRVRVAASIRASWLRDEITVLRWHVEQSEKTK